MGWVLMSERELNRVEVLSQVSRDAVFAGQPDLRVVW
jgi:hypothetical protein